VALSDPLSAAGRGRLLVGRGFDALALRRRDVPVPDAFVDEGDDVRVAFVVDGFVGRVAVVAFVALEAVVVRGRAEDEEPRVGDAFVFVLVVRVRLVDALAPVDATGLAAAERELEDLAADPDVGGFVVDRELDDVLDDRDAPAFAVVPRVEDGVDVAAAAGPVFGRFRDPGGRPRRRGAGVVPVAVEDPPALVDGRIGVRTWVACTAADPTVRAAPLTAPPTASAADVPAETAEEAAAAASDATFEASAATSDSDSATCFRRFATSLRPLLATAVASCLTRLASVFRAAASCFSSFRSSLAALFESGLTAPLASTMTSATVSTTASRRPLLPPSSRFAIERPPALPRGPVPAPRGHRPGPPIEPTRGRRQVCHLGADAERVTAGRHASQAPRFTSR
jgi:hypothetical protein